MTYHSPDEPPSKGPRWRRLRPNEIAALCGAMIVWGGMGLWLLHGCVT